jgi:Fic family protein
MRSFDASFLAQLAMPAALVRTLVKIGEFRGRQTLWGQTKPEVLAALRRIAVIESVESSSRMENVQVGPQTFDRIVRAEGAPEPADRSQAELAGYRDALDLIHKNAADMAVSEGVVLQLHKTLMRYTPAGGGSYKTGPNDIVERGPDGEISRVRFRTVAPALTPMAMGELHRRLDETLRQEAIEPLLLVPLYVHDLLCIHPFPDGNGRIARLVTVLMLARLGCDVGRYVSLERIIESTKATYYDSLAASEVGWHDGRHDHRPFSEYLLGVVLAAYRQLEESTAIDLDHGARTRLVTRAVEGLPASFRLVDVEQRCPLVTRDTIRTVLAKLRRDGSIQSVGRGRNASWRRV